MTDSDEVKLLPCPFCGGEPKLLQDGYYEPANLEKYPERTRSWVVCPCDTHWKRNTAAEAITAWNTRPPVVTDKVVERVATLRGALETCAKTFRRYSELHRAKGTTEGNLKASNNDDLAEFCESVLADDGAIASMPAVVSGGQT